MKRVRAPWAAVGPARRFAWIALSSWLLLPGCTDPAAELFRQAEGKFRGGDYLGALILYQEIADHHPRSGRADDALYWSGVIQHLYLENHTEGLRAFQHLLEAYPDTPWRTDAYRYTAAIFLRLGKVRQAIEAYTRLAEVSRDPETQQESLFRIGQIYFDAGDIDQARTEWEGLLERYPDGVYADQALYALATTFYVQENCDRAEVLLSRLIRDYPRSVVLPEARFRYATCLEVSGRLPEALREYEAIVEQYPNRAVVENRIAALRKRL